MQDEHDRMLQSLSYDGIRVSKLQLTSFSSTDRGLGATTTIKKDEILLTIPNRHLLNLKIVGKEFNFDWHKPPLPAHVALALYILVHKADPLSPLQHYIRSLPTCFATVPLTWSPMLISLLPASAKVYLEKQQVVFAKHWKLAQDYIKNNTTVKDNLGQDFSKHNFQWAWLVVNSRCIYQELSARSTRDDNYACCPLIDMINHVPSSVPHCKLSYDIKGLSIITQCPYRPGAEVFISYGAHSNEHLLCDYGFVVPQNSDNCLDLDDVLCKLLQDWHTRLLMELGYYEDYTIDLQGSMSFRTEVALRVALLSEQDCMESTDRCRKLTHFVNGRSDGRQEQPDVCALLCNVLDQEIEATRVALARLEEPDRSSLGEENIALVKQLWLDRQDNLCAALRANRTRKRRMT